MALTDAAPAGKRSLTILLPCAGAL